MTAQLSAFIATLGIYDYLLFAGSILLFILFLLLAIMLRGKLLLSLTSIILAVSAIALLPTFGYEKMHAMVFKHTLDVGEVKKLEFTEALLVKGALTNDSSHDFAACTITAAAYKVSGNALLDALYPLKPFQKVSILKEHIPAGERVEFKLFIEPFVYADEYNTTIGAQCR